MRRKSGYTIVELLVTLAIVAVLVMLIAQPAGKQTRGKAQRIKCVNNLRNLSLALRIFPDNNSGAHLSSALTNLTTLTAVDYMRALSNELSTPNILSCPADSTRKPAMDFQQMKTHNISYFANPWPHTNSVHDFLFGDRNLSTNGFPVPSGALLKVKPGMKLEWTTEMHNRQGQIAVNDGSVQIFGSPRLLQSLPLEENRLLIP